MFDKDLVHHLVCLIIENIEKEDITLFWTVLIKIKNDLNELE